MNISPDALEVARKTFEQEFQAGIEKRAQNSAIAPHPYTLYEHLQNFFCLLPGAQGKGREKREQLQGPLLGKRPFKDYLSEKNYLDNPPYSWSSQIRLDQTGEEFLKAIDESLQDEELDPDRIMELQKLAWQEGIDKESGPYPISEELARYILPAYIRLRAMGYKDYPDLGI